MGAAVILLPILYVLLSLLQKPNANWLQVKQYLLASYAIGTIKLVVLTGCLATALGVTLAWLVAGYTFPLQRFYRWALALPLAVPPYIAAYTYSAMTGYTGFVQTTLRNQWGIFLKPDTIQVMSLRGAVFVLTLFLFPYVFIITRNYLERQSAAYIENAILLGHTGPKLFFRVMLPLARPAIIGGMMLVIFEVLSDYGVANYFGVQTVSTAIFQTWFGMYDVDSAMRLAAWLMLAVIGLFVAERFWRRSSVFYPTTSQGKPLTPTPLRGVSAVGATVFCGLIFLLSFLVPVVQLVVWASWNYRRVWSPDFVRLLQNTLIVALVATALVMIVAIATARVSRSLKGPSAYALSRLMTAGHAVPGAIIAIGVLAIFLALDQALAPLYARLAPGRNALVLSMSLAMLITGYVVRFMAAGYNAIEAGYEKIRRSYAEAASTLGADPSRIFFQVEWPLLRGAVVSGLVLTLVEITKELPLALLLRPFNFNTLATKAYQYAMDERIYEAALPSLLMIGIGLLSVLLLHESQKPSGKGTRS